jgi:cation transport ATPase
MAKLTPEQEQELLDTSLRNVRSLVDQAQAEEAQKHRDAKRMAVALAVAVVVLVLLVGLFVVRRPPASMMTIKPAPAAPR